MSVINTSLTTFQADVLNSKLPVIVSCYAGVEDNQHKQIVKVVADIFFQLEKKYGQKIRFVLLNIHPGSDEMKALMDQYLFWYIPGLYYFKDGKKIDSFGDDEEDAWDMRQSRIKGESFTADMASRYIDRLIWLDSQLT